MVQPSGNDTLFQTAYLREQIIPYIGNKRRLLPLIHRALVSSCGSGGGGKRFLDLFAGSGIVSRLAKCLSFEVYANDWEYYSYVLCSGFVAVNARDVSRMYGEWGGIGPLINHLNNLPGPDKEDLYIARYFSPSDDSSPDYRRERLFYTRNNGLTIDKIRNEIERIYPGDKGDRKSQNEKMLLLAMLLYQAATHTNTSGVFKAFHKGFGGFSGDALGRIMKPISLVPPPLIDSKCDVHVYREDANKLLANETATDGRGAEGSPSGSNFPGTFDIAYVDPPYNQHQYGSNYHLLNTIALWDKPHLGNDEKGSREQYGKAGIRRDWIKTRSAYCYRDTASDTFKDLLANLDARHLLISYSNNGIIPFNDLIDMCAERGRIGIVTNRYVTYRGGRQSIRRLKSTLEFVMTVDTRKASGVTDRRTVRDAVLEGKLDLQLTKCYRADRLKEEFSFDTEGRIGFPVNGETVWIRTDGFFIITDHHLNSRLAAMGLDDSVLRRIREELLNKLIRCECTDSVEELRELIRTVRSGDDETGLLHRIPGTLKKIAHKKYRDLFFTCLSEIRELENVRPDAYEKIGNAVSDVETLAYRRFNG